MAIPYDFLLSFFFRGGGCSIFAPRRKEAESRSFWDTERVIRKALDADYSRMLKEERVLRLISKADAKVVQGEKTVKDSLEEVGDSGFFQTSENS